MGGQGSGKKPLLDREDARRILKKSRDIIERWLDNDKVDEAKKVLVCKDLLAKQIPNIQEHTGDLFDSLATKVNVTHNYVAATVIGSGSESQVQPEAIGRLPETKP